METEIANLKAVHLEGLYKSITWSKKNGSSFSAGRLKTILKELEQQDLKEVSTTDKLFDILLKYISKLPEERMAIKFTERSTLGNISGIRRT